MAEDSKEFEKYNPLEDSTVVEGEISGFTDFIEVVERQGIFPDPDYWFWHGKSNNGEILYHSENMDKAWAIRAAKRHAAQLGYVPITVIPLEGESWEL